MPRAPTDLISDRALGSLVGLAIGDALGTTLEGSQRDAHPPHKDITGGGPFHLKPGQWTDDTAMALCLADSLIAQRGRLRIHDLMKRFARWRDEGENSCTGRCFDIGWTTSGSISQFLADDNPAAGPVGPDSAGNGSIMRLAPAVIANLSNEASAIAAARMQSITTHGARTCLEACELLARILHSAINSPETSPPMTVANWAGRDPNIAAIARGSWADKERSQIQSTGYVVHTLEAALWANSNAESFGEALVLAVNLGGDADTVGAVAGQIAGAIYGYANIPSQWLDSLAWREQIEERAHSLLKIERRSKTMPALMRLISGWKPDSSR